MARVVFDNKAFLRGVTEAFAEFKDMGYADCVQRAEEIKTAARSRVHKLTHTTEESIEVEEGGDGDARWVEVGSGLPQAIYEEFGTSDTSPVPFMRAAIEEQFG